MNKRLLFAILSGGGHKHRWNPDKSGRCTVCGRMHQHARWDYMEPSGGGYQSHGVCQVCGFECPHADGFKFIADFVAYHECNNCGMSLPHNAETKYCEHNKCCRCRECAQDITKHAFNADGLCITCNYQCPHEGTWEHVGDAKEHHCSFCGKDEAHKFEMPKTALICKHCATCNFYSRHYFHTGSTTCYECEYVCTHDQPLAHGFCPVCGTLQCQHEHFDTTDYTGEVHCNNSKCGTTLKRSDDRFFVSSGKYMGGYRHYRRAPIPGVNQFQDGKSTITGIRDFTQYREVREIENGQLQEVKFAEQRMVLFALDVKTPTNFGGDYNYTVQGLVFSDAGGQLPINAELLQGDGKNIKSFKQYNKDGSLTSQTDGSYKSEDFPQILGISEEELIETGSTEA